MSVYLIESFRNASLSNSGWTVQSTSPGSGCLTASAQTTPIPGCPSGDGGGYSGTLPDALTQGALRLTNSASQQSAAIVYAPTFSSTYGLQAVFSWSAYQAPLACKASGLTFAILDGTKTLPTTYGGKAGSLGYVNLSGAYLGVGLDQSGGFSSGAGAPGWIAETIAVRGASSVSFAYITGYQAAGVAASLPFTLDSPQVTRSGVPLRKVRITLTSQGLLSVDIDTGSGFAAYVPPTDIRPVNGSTLPSLYRIGFTASTEGCVDSNGALSAESYHEVQDLVVTSAH